MSFKPDADGYAYSILYFVGKMFIRFVLSVCEECYSNKMPRRINQKDSPLELRGKIVGLHQGGKSISEISRICDLSRRQVRRWIIRAEEGEDLHTIRPGRPRVTTVQEDVNIRNFVDETPFTNTIRIREQLQLNCSSSTIQRRLREDGIYARKPARKIQLSPAQAEARVLFCRDNLDRNWQHVIFSDEKTFSTSQEAPTVLWRRNNTRFDRRNVLPNKSSGRISAGYWGWMHWAGSGEIVQVTPPSFNARTYIQILDDILLPSLNIMYPEHERNGPIIFVQDNCSVHKARIVMDWFEDNQQNIQLLPWPVKSADLNPIENLWAGICREWRDWRVHGVQERNRAALTDHVNVVWNQFRRGPLCQNLVASMHRRLQECIENNGYYIKY